MKLSKANLSQSFWLDKGYDLPKYDIDKIKENTLKNPVWLHFGAGNIFRAFPAKMQQELINIGEADKGILVCECYDEEIIPKAFENYEYLTIGITLKVDGSKEKTVIASIVDGLNQSSNKLVEIFENPDFQMASFTITEKGYAIKGNDSLFFPFIQKDIDAGPENAKSLMGLATKLLYARYCIGAFPITLVSMDNCSHNGDKLFDAIYTIACQWEKLGKVSNGFSNYIKDSSKVSFPLTMIDKITPRPSLEIKEMLESEGLENCNIIETSKSTFTACFVNCEETGYLVIEDIFTNGRPKLEKAGAIFTDRFTVDKVEKMKVCTCLNPLHTVLAVFGCLLGYDSISDEMKDEQLVDLIKKIGYTEGLPVVVDPGIISPKAFIDECINVRFPNRFVPDTPQRIASDTSQKIPVRFGETLKTYVDKGMDVSSFKYMPIFFAGWLKYLTGIDDCGKEFVQSPDPMLNELKKLMEGVSINSYKDCVKPILSNADIFGIDLYKYGLGEKVEMIFLEMLQGEGSIRKVLNKYL